MLRPSDSLGETAVERLVKARWLRWTPKHEQQRRVRQSRDYVIGRL